MLKKAFLVLLSLLLLAGLFTGCEEEVPQGSLSAYIKFDLSNVDVQDVMDTLPKAEPKNLPDEILVDNEIYTYYRQDGLCYLNFKSGNDRISMDLDEKDGCDHRFWFGSMEEAYQWLCCPVFTEHTKEIFRHCWPLDSEKGFYMPDLQQLYVAETPEDYKLDSVDFWGHRFVLIYQTQERLASGRYGAFTLTCLSEDSFREKLKNYYRFARGSANRKLYTDFNEKGATIYEYETDVGKHRHVLYTAKTEQIVWFYEDHYYVDKSYLEEGYHFARPTVFGCLNGLYFSFVNHYSDWDALYEVIPQIRIVDYKP